MKPLPGEPLFCDFKLDQQAAERVGWPTRAGQAVGQCGLLHCPWELPLAASLANDHPPYTMVGFCTKSTTPMACWGAPFDVCRGDSTKALPFHPLSVGSRQCPAFAPTAVAPARPQCFEALEHLGRVIIADSTWQERFSTVHRGWGGLWPTSPGPRNSK